MVSASVFPTTTSTRNYSFTDNNNATDPVAGERIPFVYTFHIDEVLILLIVLGIWFTAVLVFIKKWASIRITQPTEPRFRMVPPKNLDSIKIVKRAQDSIIYKTYGRKVSVCMVAREKRRLRRMHTMPCMGVGGLPGLEGLTEGLPLPVAKETEEDTTEC